MSIEYHFLLATELNIVEFSSRLDSMDMTWSTRPQHFPHLISKKCPYFLLVILDPSDNLKQSYGTSYQIATPTISCTFDFDFKRHNHDYPTAMAQIIRTVFFLLRNFDGDAVFAGINPTYLIRRSGKLLLSKEEDFWNFDPRFLEHIPTPYEWVEKLPG
ncbi:hypothetical protein ANRL4_03065 [Anaerolineae bacterium]|nr:hypothetical protein ANRL4_03065 [Anaerolineae bacterium]